MKIVADIYIPYLEEAVREKWPEVEIVPMKPEQIDAAAVRDADVLVVRTRTNVNEALLAGSRVRMVCTATIGFDHIDTAYCEAHGIQWMSCPGCNAQAVCDYVEEAIEVIQNSKFKIQNSSPTIGVVGVGHVGSLVAKMAERKGWRVLLNDPPKGIGVSLDEIARESDVITFHVPLKKSEISDQCSVFSVQDSEERYPTYHMCDEGFLAKTKNGAVIINAARGGVVDEKALLKSGRTYVLDTWENEPEIDRDVVANAFRASMHIAGYSEEGKRNASQMCLDAIAAAYGLPVIQLAPIQKKELHPGWLQSITEQLKVHPEAFEDLRKNYPLR